MAPPISYITINTIPFSRVVTQAEFNSGAFGNAPNEVWFKFPSNGLSKVALGGFTNAGGSFIPQTQLYDFDGTTLLHSFINGDYGWYNIIDSTTDKYIKIVKTTGGASDFNFTVQFDTRVVNNISTLQNGDLLINDDTGGPAYLTGADGTFRTFLDPFSSGEYGALLPDNISIWEGAAHGANRFEIYNLLTFLNSVNITSEHIITASDTDFFLCKRVAPHNVYRIAENGTFLALGTLPSGAIKICGFGASRDGSILYWGRQSGDASIHRWDTATGTPLTDLYTIPGYDIAADRVCITAFNNGGEIIVLPDGSVIFWWSDSSLLANFIVHVNPVGILINSYNQGTLTVNHLIWVKNSLSNVYVWYLVPTMSDVGRFANYDILTGTILNSFDIDLFNSGVNANISDPVMFGPATSCLAMRFTLASPVIPSNLNSGIYKIVPGKRQDTLWTQDFAGTEDVKIPNPTARLGYIG